MSLLEDPTPIRIDPRLIKFNPENTNTHDGSEFKKLIESVREHGIFTPPTVRMLPGGIYETIAGEGRVKAAIEIGLDEIIVLSRGIVDDKTTHVFMLIDNAVRNLDFINECVGIAQLFKDGMSIRELERQFIPDNPGSQKVLEQLGIGNFDADIIQMIQRDIAKNSERKEFWNITIFRNLFPLRIEIKHHRVATSGLSEYKYTEVRLAVEKLISGDIKDSQQLRDYTSKRINQLYKKTFNKRLQSQVQEELDKSRKELENKYQLEIAGVEEKQKTLFEQKFQALERQIQSLESLNGKLAKEALKRPDKIEEKESELFEAKELLKRQRQEFETVRQTQEFQLDQAIEKIKREQESLFAQQLEEHKEKLEKEFEENRQHLERYYETKNEKLQLKAKASFQSSIARLTELLSSTHQLGLMLLTIQQGFDLISNPELMALSAQIVITNQTTERIQEKLHEIANTNTISEDGAYERSR